MAFFPPGSTDKEISVSSSESTLSAPASRLPISTSLCE